MIYSLIYKGLILELLKYIKEVLLTNAIYTKEHISPKLFFEVILHLLKYIDIKRL